MLHSVGECINFAKSYVFCLNQKKGEQKMKKIFFTRLAITITSLLGLSKASASNTDESIVRDYLENTDSTFKRENNSIEFDKTYIYTNQILAKGAVSFLTEKKIPFAIRYLIKDHITISLKDKDVITLSTQRWGASARQLKD